MSGNQFVTYQFLDEDAPRIVLIDVEEVPCEVSDDGVTWTRIDTSSLFKGEPPAKPHPLQLLSEQPSAFGQSMWRPWEK